MTYTHFVATLQGMAVPQWLKISETELVALGPSEVVKISRRDNIVTLLHSDASVTTQTYADYTAAMAAINDFTAITEAVNTGLPSIETINPQSIDTTATPLPQTITVTGVAFDASATIILTNYTTSGIVLVTTFVSSTVLTAVVAAAGAGTYDVVYSDTNGLADKFPNGLLIV